MDATDAVKNAIFDNKHTNRLNESYFFRFRRYTQFIYRLVLDKPLEIY